MSDATRITTFISTLREAYKAGMPRNYNNGSPTDKLIILTGNVNDLCWEIAATTKRSAHSNKTTTTDSIKHSATNIINICITELKNLDHTTEDTIELIVTEGALWFWNITQHPLDKLDKDVPPADRIQSLYVATGDLMEWWPNKISPQNNAYLKSELERTFANLAYEAACATISANHQFITD
jgi:hypothetical protein